MHRRLALAATALAGALVLGACGSSGQAGSTSTSAPPPTEPPTTSVASLAARTPAAAVPAQAGTTPAGTAPTGTASGRRTVAVSATGSVSAKPDTLTIQLGVTTQAPKAKAALDQTSAKAQALIDTLVASGVAKDDITTADISVWPRYDNGSSAITGYQASNNVVAKLRDLSKAGAVIDAAASAVSDSITIGGLSFSIEDPTAVYAQARTQAVQRAKQQADQLAGAAGATVGQVVSISEQSQYVPTPMAYAGAATTAAGADKSVPVQPGQTTVTLTVDVTYELT